MSGGAETAIVVLAGGEGRRMGGAKPLRRFGATTLIGWALELARRYGDVVAVAVRDPAQVDGVGDVPLLTDDAALGGPIAGLASALGFASQSGAMAVLTLPCDTPMLPPDLLLRLRARLEAGAGVAVAVSQDRLHPACALWRRAAGDRLAAYVGNGRSSLTGFAEACGMARVDWPTGDIDPFANANTPDELRRLQRLAEPGANLPFGA